MVDVDDLLEPIGPLEREFFPDEDSALDDRLQQYLDTAQAKVDAYTGTLAADAEDEAVKAWALHLAFRALWLLLVSTPSSASMEGTGSAAFAKDQRDAYKEQSEYYAAQYDLWAPPVPVQETGFTQESFPVRNAYRW